MNFVSHFVGKLNSNLMNPRVWINQNVKTIIENRKKLNVCLIHYFFLKSKVLLIVYFKLDKKKRLHANFIGPSIR